MNIYINLNNRTVCSKSKSYKTIKQNVLIIKFLVLTFIVKTLFFQYCIHIFHTHSKLIDHSLAKFTTLTSILNCLNLTTTFLCKQSDLISNSPYLGRYYPSCILYCLFFYIISNICKCISKNVSILYF